ncbi:MAG: undecaprenyldiphospho-muramoylpentapeptide beta-N-acetylglucosaminyltransferase [Candidatus Omnitrophica bacterium]|nr:undecaprenyldiphospho-muramoylpentapeptide beta-N-acetylglucosaminyltransferase [Candidatus Omnitrophota bacterium]
MKIVLATGGSGGHIFPAIKTAEYLSRQGHQVYFAGALLSVEDRLKNLGYGCLILDVEGFRPGTALRFAYKMIAAFSRCRQWIRSIQPDVVVGFGSYSSFPMIFSANTMGIRTVLHEQNVIPGKANRAAARFVKTIAVSFEETKTYFPKHKTVWTGCPCNSQRPQKSRSELLKAFGLRDNFKTILVLGGSQGSHYLNEVFFDSICRLQGVQVIHMTGKSDQPAYQKKYESITSPSLVCAFIEDIECAYAVADLVIARAGAATVFELASFKIPSILVPYPYAHGHQRANARVLEKAGHSVVIEQADLNVEKLCKVINRFLETGRLLDADNEKQGSFVTNPTQLLSNTICLTP